MFFDIVRKELRVEREIEFEHFPIPQPYREDYCPMKSWPRGGPIPGETRAILLQSGELKPEDSDVGKHSIFGQPNTTLRSARYR